MFLLEKDFRFEAAHKLPHHDGKCARLHGHSWMLTVRVQGVNLCGTGPKKGMLIDYADIKHIVEPLVNDCLDHHYLNETTKLENPTSEALAHWVFRNLKPAINELGFVSLHSITIQETCTARCTYDGGSPCTL